MSCVLYIWWMYNIKLVSKGIIHLEITLYHSNTWTNLFSANGLEQSRINKQHRNHTGLLRIQSYKSLITRLRCFDVWKIKSTAPLTKSREKVSALWEPGPEVLLITLLYYLSTRCHSEAKCDAWSLIFSNQHLIIKYIWMSLNISNLKTRWLYLMWSINLYVNANPQ